MEKLDPFRPAENETPCPKCGESFGWNDEDGLEGQSCGCGYVFTAVDKYAAECFADNDYLRGDDCRSTRSYLRGWIGSLFRRGEDRAMSEAEIAARDGLIDAFVKEPR